MLSIPVLGAFQLQLTPFNSTPTFACMMMGGEDASRKSWPESERARKIRERESKSQRKAISVIVFGHLKRLWMDGQIILIASLALTAARMAFLAVCLATFDKAKECAAAAFGFF